MLAPLSNYWGGGAEGWPPSSYAYGFHTFVPILGSLHCTLSLLSTNLKTYYDT